MGNIIEKKTCALEWAEGVGVIMNKPNEPNISINFKDTTNIKTNLTTLKSPLSRCNRVVH